MTDNDGLQDDIHKAVGHVIRVADQLGILTDILDIEGVNLWAVMHEIERFMEKSLED